MRPWCRFCFVNSSQEEAGGFPKTMAAIGGMFFLLFGLWAMADASSFYDSIALFEPYNAHFIQDLGAFQVGLGLTLILAAFVTSDALVVGLIGVGTGASLHVVSHLLDLDAGGNPGLDIPSLSILGVLLLVAGVIRWRRIQ